MGVGRRTALAGLSAAAVLTSGVAAQSDRSLATDAAALHERLLVMDTHLDTPANFTRPGFSLLDRHDALADQSQVDLPRMVEGGLDGGFWVIYTPQGPLTEAAYRAARDAALFRAVTIREAAAKHPEHFELAFRSEDAARIAGAGKRVMYQSIENAYPLGEDVSLLETFYAFGVRMVGPVHFRDNQFADSATDLSATWDGLSPLGEELVREANRLGVVLDGSHAADSAVEDMLALSKAPIILSHTGVSALYDHPRNISDALLRKVAAAGGVIQINALGAYLENIETSAERQAGLDAITAEFGEGAGLFTLEGAELEAYLTARRELDLAHPPTYSTFERFMEQMLHALDIVGPDHVGMGADWDGGGGVAGMEDVAALSKVTARLLAEGYSAEEIEKIWSGNMLRVLAAAEAVAAELAAAD